MRKIIQVPWVLNSSRLNAPSANLPMVFITAADGIPLDIGRPSRFSLMRSMRAQASSIRSRRHRSWLEVHAIDDAFDQRIGVAIARR